MTEDKEKDNGGINGGISRRKFIQGTTTGVALIAGGALLSSAIPAAHAQTKTIEPLESKPAAVPSQSAPTPSTTGGAPIYWDYTADVVVVGYGGAGAAAAIEANDAGANVILIEKMPKGFEGGNTSAAGGGVVSHQDVAIMTAYMNDLQSANIGGVKTPFDLPAQWIQPWCELMALNKDWVTRMCTAAPGYTWAYAVPEYPELPGAIAMGEKLLSGSPPAGQTQGNALVYPYARGMYLFGQLRNRVNERPITVLSGTPMTGLIQNPDTKEILGVVATRGGDTINIKAKKGVVLACGGFENNLRMRQNFLPQPMVLPHGTTGNTGDGIIAAMKAGADLWHMNYSSCSSFNILVPGYPDEVGPVIRLGVTSKALWVDKYAKRFCNQAIGAINGSAQGRHGKAWYSPVWWYDGEKEEFPRVPTYMIFDDATRKSLTTTGGGSSLFGSCWWTYHSGTTLSNDGSAEIAKGWIYQANTIGDLAKAMGLDPTTLSNTVTTYNGYCAAGADPDFGQYKNYLIPVSTAPFYGVIAYIGFSGTEGGPRRNPDGQVLDAADQPIPRLYAAGELGSYLGWQYNGGCNVGEALATGRKAGQNAAALTPWT